MTSLTADLLERGKMEGRMKNRMENIRILIESLQEFGISKEEIINKAVDKYHLSEEAAISEVEKYWRD